MYNNTLLGSNKNVSSNENNANKHKLQKNEELTLTIKLSVTDLRNIMIGLFVIIVLIGLVVL